MSEPYLAEIRIFGFNFAPRGYAQCDGQLLPIDQFQSLFSLLGTTYGGDGRTTFALPELRGRTPIHKASTHPLGQRSGEEAHPLTVQEMPQHTHQLSADSNNATLLDPNGNLIGRTAGDTYHTLGTDTVTMDNQTLATVGQSVPHNNMQPYLTLNFCIALQGVFPPRN